MKDALDELIREGIRAVLRSEATRGRQSDADRVRALTVELLLLAIQTVLRLTRADQEALSDRWIPGSP